MNYESHEDKAKALKDELSQELEREVLEGMQILLDAIVSRNPDETREYIQAHFDRRASRRQAQGDKARAFFEAKLLAHYSEELTDSILLYLDKAQELCQANDANIEIYYPLFSQLIDGCLESNWTEVQASQFMADNPIA